MCFYHIKKYKYTAVHDRTKTRTDLDSLKRVAQSSGYIKGAGSSGGSASDYKADGRRFAPQTGRPFLGPTSLDWYWSPAGNLTMAEKGTGHSTPPCRWPSILGAAMCPSATLKY